MLTLQGSCPAANCAGTSGAEIRLRHPSPLLSEADTCFTLGPLPLPVTLIDPEQSSSPGDVHPKVARAGQQGPCKLVGCLLGGQTRCP